MSTWRHEPPPDPESAETSPFAHIVTVVILFGVFSLVGILIALLFLQILYPSTAR